MISCKHIALTLTTAVAMSLCAMSQADSVTIGGTPANDKAARGFSAMFTGDRFENFRHVERFTPVATMPASPQPWNLGANRNTLSYRGQFMGEQKTLAEFIELSNTSALLVIKNGEVVHESYRHGDSATSLHASFSVAKSFTSALLGIALGEGLIDSLDDPIRKYLPELTSDSFDGVSIKHVLQMSSGVEFSEVYTDPESDINRMTREVPPLTYLAFINSLDRAHPPGTYNHYASINTQLLGILLIRVADKTLTEYMIEKLWHPLGMEQRGLWVLDEEGIELSMGGMAASARDYAKLGLLYLNDGKRGTTRILPEDWVQQSVTPDAPHLLPGENPRSSNVSGYQYQWWTPRDWDGDYLARGIWGQNIYVHPGNNVVIVKLAADQKNFDANFKLAYIDYLQDMAQSMTDQP